MKAMNSNVKFFFDSKDLTIYNRKSYRWMKEVVKLATNFDPDQLHYSQLPLSQGVVSFPGLNCNVLLKCFEPNTILGGHS